MNEEYTTIFIYKILLFTDFSGNILSFVFVTLERNINLEILSLLCL